MTESKKYSNGEITVVWQPEICTHATLCWKQLRQVFNPAKRPWVDIDAADSARIIEQVEKCPSGALTYYRNNEGQQTPEIVSAESIVEPVTNGPLLVYGNLVVKDHEGNEKHHNKVTAFCRCGASANKPYCDGTHIKIGFTA